jgi:hypothetical protein
MHVLSARKHTVSIDRGRRLRLKVRENRMYVWIAKILTTAMSKAISKNPVFHVDPRFAVTLGIGLIGLSASWFAYSVAGLPGASFAGWGGTAVGAGGMAYETASASVVMTLLIILAAGCVSGTRIDTGDPTRKRYRRIGLVAPRSQKRAS